MEVEDGEEGEGAGFITLVRRSKPNETCPLECESGNLRINRLLRRFGELIRGSLHWKRLAWTVYKQVPMAKSTTSRTR